MTDHPRVLPLRRSRIFALLAMITALSLAAPVAAQAADATKAQYGTAVSQIGGEVGGGQSQSSGLQKRVVGGLPFTGLDVIALAAVAVALTSMGLALRRLTAERQLS
jgi:hypothetical protein